MSEGCHYLLIPYETFVRGLPVLSATLYQIFLGSVVAQCGKHGGSMVERQTVVLQSRVQIRHLPSPQLTANLLVGCHLGWHLAAG
jgi:hypothetical protein